MINFHISVFTVIFLSVGLGALLTSIEKILCILQAHTSPQGVYMRILVFFFPSFFFSHTFCGQLVPEWNLDVTVICQELLLATHPLNVCPLQPGSRKNVLSSFLFERCILFDILKNILKAFCC